MSKPASGLPSLPQGARRVRICIVAPSVGILGGQAVQAARLIEHLRTFPELEPALLPVNPVLPGPLGWMQRIKYIRTVITSVRYVASLLVRLRSCDVVHVFSASYFSFVLAPLPAMLVARLYGRKVVLNYHSGEADDHLSRWPSAVRAMALAHEIIVPSGYLVDVFARFGVKARAIGNFVDVDGVPYRRRERLEPRFLTNRNLEPLYNVACVLRAFSRIQQAVPEARLVVAGFGTQRARLEGLAKELELRDVTFSGRISPDRMAALYDEADLFLNGSDIDNMPLSILDAFAAGTPVVTTDAGGIPYMVEHEVTGLIVPRGDDASMAAEAVRLLRDAPLARRIGDAARHTCVARYTWRAVGKEWVALYASLANPTPRRGIDVGTGGS